MKLLAIETSSEHASIALDLDGAMLEHTLEGHANHSERLLPSIQRMLAESGVSLGSLDAVVYGAGPGAFTGLRLACAAAQGLAMGAGVGVIGICGLDALSLHGKGAAILVATDARMGEVYTATYRVSDGKPMRSSDIVCMPPESLLLPDDDVAWFGVGSGFVAYFEKLHPLIKHRLSGVDGDARVTAAGLLQLARPRVVVGDIQPPECAAPLYVRNKVALTTAERLARGGRA